MSASQLAARGSLLLRTLQQQTPRFSPVAASAVSWRSPSATAASHPSLLGGCSGFPLLAARRPLGARLFSRSCLAFAADAGAGAGEGPILEVDARMGEPKAEVGFVEDGEFVPVSQLLPAEETAAGGILELVNPVTWATEGMQLIHGLGLPWWATIVAVTFASRLLLSPLAIKSMHISNKMAEIGKAHQLKIKMAGPDPVVQKQARDGLYQAYRDAKVSPFAAFKPMLVQFPVFITFFLTLKRLAAEDPSLVEGGALWFLNLCEVDDMYRIAIMSTFFIWANFEYTWKKTAQITGAPIHWGMKAVMRGFSVFSLAITSTFPQAIQLYWISSNIFSLLQSFIIHVPSVRRLLGLPLARSTVEAPKVVAVVDPVAVTRPSKAQKRKQEEQKFH